MIVAVDSNILLDLVVARSSHSGASRDALARVLARDTAITCEPVLAEIAPAFGSLDALDEFLSDTPIALVRSGQAVLYAAGQAWRHYRARSRGVSCGNCGAPVRMSCEKCGERVTVRQHLLPDFIIGAHALAHADAILTRDRRCYKTYFPKLRLM